MAANIINGHELQATAFVVQEKKPTGNKLSENAFIAYNGKPGKFYIQTPVMRLPFGVSPPNEAMQITKYSATLSFDGMDKNPKLRAFHDALVELDEYMIDLGVERSKEWFGKPLVRAAVEEKYTRIIKAPKDEKYAPTMKAQVREVTKGYKTEGGKRVPDPASGTKLEPILYDLEDNIIDYGDKEGICDAVPRNSLAMSRLDTGGVWFTKAGYGISFRLNMARVKAQAVTNQPPPNDREEFEAAETYTAPVHEESPEGEGAPEGDGEQPPEETVTTKVVTKVKPKAAASPVDDATAEETPLVAPTKVAAKPKLAPKKVAKA